MNSKHRFTIKATTLPKQKQLPIKEAVLRQTNKYTENYLTDSLRVFPTLNATLEEAAILSGWRVFGLTPFRALR